MSYRPVSASKTGFFFSAYRSSAFTSTSANTQIPFTNGNDVSILAGSVQTSNRSVYVVGEVQADSSSQYLLSDVKILENAGSKAEGYQVRNNASGTVCMDDAAYGINSGNLTSFYVGELYPGGGGSVVSESYKTRMMGVYTR